MTVSFIDGCDKSRTDVYQDNTYIGNIRCTKLEDFIFQIEEDTCLNFSELEQIYKKMRVMDSCIPKGN